MTQATIDDMASLNYCRRGCRRFVERHNLDWSRVRREGIDTRTLRQFNDAMAERLADYAEARERGQQ